MSQPVSYNKQEEHTKVVEAPWGQPLREVGGKQETGEEGEEEVVTVTGQTVARVTASPAAEKDLHAEITKILLNEIYPENTKNQQIYLRVLQYLQRFPHTHTTKYEVTSFFT